MAEPTCVRHGGQPERRCGCNTLPATCGGGKAAAIGAPSSSSEAKSEVSMLLIDPITDIGTSGEAAASDRWEPVEQAESGRHRIFRRAPQLCKFEITGRNMRGAGIEG